MSGCGRTSEHDPHSFVTTRGGYPPVEHTEQCPGVPKPPDPPPSSEKR